MSGTSRRQQKTWSLLGDVRRKPSPYEVVTSQFHYHFRRQPAPFELDPRAPLNVWYLRYREGSTFQVYDWEGFRDPAKFTYRDYVAFQHDREVYLDGVVDRCESDDTVSTVSPGWLRTARELVVPLRFPLHIMQMVALYIGQMAPSSFITNAAHFQAADEMRRIQRIAYWNVTLAQTYDAELAATATARTRFEDDPAWQPLRKVLEELLVAYDWGEAFVGLELAVKPAVDALVNDSIRRLAAANGDVMLGDLLEDFSQDANRARKWSDALVSYTISRNPGIVEVLAGHLERWSPPALEAVEALAGLFSEAPVPIDAADVVAAARRSQYQIATAVG